jgi:hypothetical protein
LRGFATQDFISLLRTSQLHLPEIRDCWFSDAVRCCTCNDIYCLYELNSGTKLLLNIAVEEILVDI